MNKAIVTNILKGSMQETESDNSGGHRSESVFGKKDVPIQQQLLGEKEAKIICWRHGDIIMYKSKLS